MDRNLVLLNRNIARLRRDVRLQSSEIEQLVENPRDRVAGFRVLHLLPGIGPASAQRVLDHMAEATNPLDALCILPSPPRAGEDWAAFIDAVGNLRYSEWPSDLERARLWYEPHLDRIHEDAEVRRADLIQLEQIASGYPSRERFLTELTLDPPDATSDQAGVPLLDEDYLILSTVEVSLRTQRGRWLHAVGSRSRHLRRTRRGTPPALRRDDARERRSPSCGAATLLHTRSAFARRPAHLCIADPFHSREAARPVRAHELAHSAFGRHGARPKPGP